MTNSISIVIPNYNGLAVLKENLNSVVLLKNHYKEVKEIIIVDDASTDTSVDFIKSNYPSIRVIKKAVNSGFSETVNLGFKNVQTKFVLLLNTDVKPSSNLIKELLPFFENPLTFAVGCLEKSKEGVTVIERGRGIGAIKKGFLIHKRGDVVKENTLWVSGGSSMLSKKIWDTLGGLDLSFGPFYWEDIDISYRALKGGYKVYFARKAVVYHEHDKGAIRTHYKTSFVEKVAYRNQIMFFWKNISDASYILQHIFYLIYNFFLFLFTAQFQYIGSYIEALQELPHMMYERRKLKRIWKISDKEVLNQFHEEFEKNSV